ncbi:hypothetical protein [Tolypothrix sp. VBCCA 56010]|uniref:hypothetical protein n=1 Tax=Tolypothrix sp. VBCCA 56010 TaxID=3137731 RepID=UPI003D7E0CE2
MGRMHPRKMARECGTRGQGDKGTRGQGDKGELGELGERNFTQCPMPIAPCPMPHAQLPITYYP